FRVRFRAERVALAQQKRLYLRVVFDHAVVHERKFPVAADVRVRVGVGHGAVGGPAGVSDSRRSSKPLAGNIFSEIFNPSCLLHHLEATALGYTDAGGVVAAILQPLQPLEYDGNGVLLTHIAYDAA